MKCYSTSSLNLTVAYAVQIHISGFLQGPSGHTFYVKTRLNVNETFLNANLWFSHAQNIGSQHAYVQSNELPIIEQFLVLVLHCKSGNHAFILLPCTAINLHAGMDVTSYIS
jgi:hypothetical protein